MVFVWFCDRILWHRISYSKKTIVIFIYYVHLYFQRNLCKFCIQHHSPRCLPLHVTMVYMYRTIYGDLAPPCLGIEFHSWHSFTMESHEFQARRKPSRFLQNPLLGGGFKYFWNVHPNPWGNDPIWLAHIFQMGWFNHHLYIVYLSLEFEAWRSWICLGINKNRKKIH